MAQELDALPAVDATGDDARHLADDLALLKAAIEHSGEAIAVIDSRFRLKYASARFRALVPRAADGAFDGTPLADLLCGVVGPNGETGGEDAVRRAAAQAERLAGLVDPDILECTLSDGTAIELRFAPLPGGGLVATAISTTERRRKDLALLRAEQRLHAVLNHSAAVIYLKDTAGRYLLVNRQFEQMVGRDSGRIVGNNDADLFPPETAARIHAGDRQALETGQRIDGEEILSGPLGPRIFKTARIPILNAYSMAEGLCAIATDITESKNVEARLRQALAELDAVFENASFGIAVVGDGRIRRVNGYLAAMFGYDRDELADACPATLYATEEEYQTYGREALAVLAAGRTYRAERLLKRRNGGLFWCYLVGSALDRDHPARGAIWLVEDMTERKKAQDALVAAMAAAEQANRAKSEFLANMSHELRTPLNAIIGFSDLIRSQILGPIGNDQYLGYVEDIHRSGRHLLTLVNDILDLSKIEAGRFELCEETVDLAAVINDCTAMVAVRMRDCGVALENNLPAALPNLYADRTSVAQVVLNLLSNAAKFTEPGGQVRLSAGFDDDGGFALIVADTGIGIPPEAIESVFEPFQQGSATISRTHGGTGLGLPISRRLMQLHGGSIAIDSRVGEGTTATVTFPPERVRGQP